MHGSNGSTLNQDLADVQLNGDPMDELDFSAWKPQRANHPPRWRWNRVLAIAVGLSLHLALFLLLLLPIHPFKLNPPVLRSTSVGLQLQLIITTAPLRTALHADHARRLVTATGKKIALPTSLNHSGFAMDTIDVQKAPSALPGATTLLAGIATAAAGGGDVTQNSKWAPALKATPPLPGRSQPFIELPLVHRRQPSPQALVSGLLHFIGGNANRPADPMQERESLVDPLRATLGQLSRALPDPDCSDPEHPRLDESCLGRQ